MLKPRQETQISKAQVKEYIFSYTLLFENIKFPIMVKYPSHTEPWHCKLCHYSQSTLTNKYDCFP